MTEPVKEINTRSLSQYNLYTRCSEQYRLERVEKIPTPPAGWLIQGTSFHTSIEEWERSGRTADAVSIYLEAYDRQVADERERWPDLNEWQRPPRHLTLNDIANRRERGMEQVRQYIAHALSAPWRVWELPDGSPALEVGFRLDLGEVIVNGYIDVVIEWPNGAISCRDYKTGSKKPSTPIQLGIYDLALREMFGVEAWYGDFWMAKEGKASDLEPLFRYTREYVTEIMTDLNRAIEAGLYLPNPGDHCRMCSVRKHCREVGDLETAVRVASVS